MNNAVEHAGGIGVRRRVLAIIVKVDEKGPPRVPPAREHGVVLPEISRVLHIRDRHPRLLP